jgi:hypothetical protein
MKNHLRRLIKIHAEKALLLMLRPCRRMVLSFQSRRNNTLPNDVPKAVIHCFFPQFLWRGNSIEGIRFIIS